MCHAGGKSQPAASLLPATSPETLLVSRPHQVSYLASPHPPAWLITVLCTLQAAHSCLQTRSPARYQHFWMLYSLCVFTASSSLLTFLPCSTTPAGEEIEAPLQCGVAIQLVGGVRVSIVVCGAKF